MQDDLLQPRCAVFEGGYEWVEAIDATRPQGQAERQSYLVARGAAASGAPPRRRLYNPVIECPALFREFAELDAAPEAIVAFANRYGPLGPGQPDIGDWVKVAGEHDARYGERIDLWQQEITYLRDALETWDLVQVGELEGLTGRIRWTAPDRVVYLDRTLFSGTPTELDIVSPSRHPEILPSLQVGDLRRPALLYVQMRVNQFLYGRASAALFWSSDQAKLELSIVPTGLQGVLWLQLAQAIAGGKRYRRCMSCGGWFELHEDTNRAGPVRGRANSGRTSRLFCSDACRSKAYRARQARARELYRAGQTVQEIAAELESDVETVSGWMR